MAKKKLIEKSTNNNGMILLQPYFAMLLVLFLALVFSIITYFYGYNVIIMVALGVATTGLGAFTWKASRSRNDFGRHHAVLTMLSIGGWLIASVNFGLFTPGILLTWLMGGLTLALSWNIRSAIKTNERQTPIEDFFEEINMAGTRWRITKKTKDVIEGEISLKRGSGTVDMLQKAKGKLASFFGVPENGIRIMPNTDNASKATMKIVARDMLKEVRKYTFTPERLTANDPMTIGWYEDGKPEMFSLHSKDLGAAHMLVQGMNGSGKSEAAKVIFSECFKREELEIWVIDISKGSQTLGLLEPYLDWVITDERIADLLFKKFKKIIKDRADYLGKKHLPKWEPGCGLTFLYLHVEEASGLIANNPAFIKMMETARSTGIQITASLQRASYVSIDTAARAQFSAVLCFGVQTIDDAMFALPDEVIDAGANPSIWKNRKQGYNYLAHPTADDEYWITPARTFLVTNSELQTAGENRVDHELDPVTMAAIGDLYHAEMDEDPENDEEELEEYFPTKEQEELDDELTRELQAKYGDAVLDFDVPEEMTPEAARQVLEDKLQEFKDSGIREFTAPELGEVLVKTGRSRAWLRKILEKKVQDSELDKEDFTYRFM